MTRTTKLKLVAVRNFGIFWAALTVVGCMRCVGDGRIESRSNARIIYRR